MRDVATKSTGGNLPATVFNSTQEELENTVTSADLTLDPDAGPDTDKNMLPKSIAGYAGGSWAYAESGAVDAHVVAIASNLKPPTKYFDNLMVAYIPGNINTSTTVTVNVASLGAKNIRIVGGGLPPVGSIKNDRGLILKYNDGAGYFEIIKGVIDDHDHSAADSEGGNLGEIQTTNLTLTGSPSGTPDANTFYKENIPKVLLAMDGTGVIAIDFSFNVTSIVDDAVGNWTVNFDRDFDDTDYLVVFGGLETGTDRPYAHVIEASKAVGSVGFQALHNDNTPVDVDGIYLAIYGNQS